MSRIGEVSLPGLGVSYRRRGSVVERRKSSSSFWHPIHDSDWKLLTPHELRVIADLVEHQQPTLPDLEWETGNE